MLPDCIRRRARQIALALNGLFSAGLTVVALVHFNSAPHPAPQTQLGSVAIDLERLGHRLTYEDLQSAGMFSNMKCRRCDFSPARTERVHLQDFSNPGFMGTLTLSRGRDEIWLHFYGKDVPVGKQSLEQALQALRVKFPGREDAIRQVGGG